ncbi:hypothetical protein UJ101_02414 [Flavobacteriaceae bacterium UJ101]|nr:hypothetical protein UJ101_02414 [Flavobacteriaceae bacterium UJ101]
MGKLWIICVFFFVNCIPFLPDEVSPSKSINESKEREAFIAEYASIRKEMKIREKEYLIDRAFLEYNWVEQGLIFETTKINKNAKVFYLMLKDKNTMEEGVQGKDLYNFEDYIDFKDHIKCLNKKKVSGGGFAHGYLRVSFEDIPDRIEYAFKSNNKWDTIYFRKVR